MCLQKGSRGETGTGIPWVGQSCPAGEKEDKPAIPDLVEGACFMFCPHPTAVPSPSQWGPWKPPALWL